MHIHIDDSQLLQIVLRQGHNKIYLNYNNGILVSTDTVPITEDAKKMTDREMIDKAAEFWGTIPSRPEDVDLTSQEDNKQDPSDWSSIAWVKEMQEELKNNVHIPTTEQTLNHYSTILPPRVIGEENQAHYPSTWHKILTFSPESPIIITSVTKREEGETPSQSCCRDGFLPQPEYLCRTLAFHRE